MELQRSAEVELKELLAKVTVRDRIDNEEYLLTDAVVAC